MNKKSFRIGLVGLLILGFIILIGCKPESNQTLKILSYNVWNGFQHQDTSIRAKYMDWVKKLDPDIVAYQEMNYHSQRDVEDLADEYFHPFAIQQKEDGYPLSITSKMPIVNVQRVLDNLGHGYLYGNTYGIHLFVVHLHPGSYRKRQEEIKTVLAHAALCPDDEMIMIVGDFNAVSPVDSINYSEGSVYYDIELLRTREHMHVQNLKEDETLDYSVIQSVLDAGFVDVYDLINKGKFKSSTLWEESRIDFAFVNHNFSEHVIYADIIHDEITDQISDHYPVYFEIKLKAD